MSAVLFLDIDGVLNPWKAHNPHKHSRHYRKYPIPMGDGFLRPWVSDEHGSRLLALRPVVRIVWATTWIWHPDSLEIYAEQSGLPHGLERIEFTDAEHDGAQFGVRGCGKLEGVKRWLETNGLPDQLVWCDDLLGPDDYDWAKSLSDRGLAVSCLIKPDQAVGLTQGNFDWIQKFLDNP